MLIRGLNSPLTLQEASKSEGIIILGALTLKQLQARGQCTFFVNADGVIELANPVELSLDAHSEEHALQVLFRQYQYSDEQMLAYLKGRSARLLRSTP